jgi:hypothetical protein
VLHCGEVGGPDGAAADDETAGVPDGVAACCPDTVQPVSAARVPAAPSRSTSRRLNGVAPSPLSPCLLLTRVPLLL